MDIQGVLLEGKLEIKKTQEPQTPKKLQQTILSAAAEIHKIVRDSILRQIEAAWFEVPGKEKSTS